ncbi:RNA 2',3'-cyclic phosphodiesterase [Haloarcula argentinensis]|uniref:RNA 2',3'-cyclic phosphodiesterase n=1 Tax=Haloarcula argentinensis TaxID=43776 RepID=A0A830FL18_HALAR|nr:RNA 2',3'-cyclic phosphodiesterase [Haloarcula argentinensis]EMA22483.1 2'-5' RNA ligase [Haloarcula argentinensis DSM 12282]MDS0252207.1 RNA 2',3'-cyclic phosphodiesterase [Haloarcula argentinensis]GGM34203.1 RNA 2',3'-cyclic phosphodiesterase [Haloarcula argentinensis]
MAKRLFVSVDLDGLEDAVASVQARFDGISGLRLTDSGQAHVTLKFLGDTDSDRIDDVVAALETAVEDSGVDPFEAEFGGLGVFPSLSYISVVWIGVHDGQGDAELTALHEAIEDRTVAMGFDPEDHRFTPHATIARMDHAGGKETVQHVVENDDPAVGRLRVAEIRLKESELGPDGPTYRTVDSVSL